MIAQNPWAACRRTIGAFLAALWLVAGCASPTPVSLRHPDYRPADIRRPAVVLQVSLDQGGFGEGAFSRQERTLLPDRFEVGVIEALNARGIFPVDLALIAHRAYRGASSPIDRIDRTQALTRAQQLRADTLLIIDMHLGRAAVFYCRETRRPFQVRSTVLTVAVEVRRVADGTQLLLESPSADQQLTDIVTDCMPKRKVHRQTIQELTDAGISRALGLLMRR